MSQTDSLQNALTPDVRTTPPFNFHGSWSSANRLLGGDGARSAENNDVHRLLSSLKGGLIVSCQAQSGDPLDNPAMLAALARSAEAGGAVGVRAQGVANLAAIRAATSLPLIGLKKVDYDDSDVYITPTFSDAVLCAEAGSDLIAIDATARPRPRGETLPTMIRRIRDELQRPVMADVATLEEGLAAEAAGVAIVATTLAGYTPQSPMRDGPDWDLLDALVRHCTVPVILEGRVWTPAEAREGLNRGAWAVVVGTAITAPGAITRRFVDAMTTD